MRIKLTLQRTEDRSVNLAVTADATATVGDVATALFAGDPENKAAPVPERLTLRVVQAEGDGRTLDPASDLLQAGLRSGSTVSLVAQSRDFATPGESRGPAAAVLRVLAGPDAGREFPLPVGSSYVGRDRDVDVRLTDPLVSKRHARITVGDAIEVYDTNSANGVLIGGTRVSRAPLTAAEEVLLGDTVVTVVPLRRVGNVPPSSPVIEFNRSPRVVRRIPKREIPAPAPPEAPRGERLPVLAMVAPLVMGAVLWVVTHQLLAILFVALSPLLMLGTWLSQRSGAKRTFEAQKKQFVASLAAVEDAVRQAHAVERAIRLSANPSVAETVEAVERLSPLLWTLRPEHDTFLTVRLGVGSSPARTVVRMPGSNNTRPEFWSRLEDLERSAAEITDVPVVVDMSQVGAIGVAGRSVNARPVARGLVLQLAALHAPGEVLLGAIASRSSRPEWEWMEWLPHAGSSTSALGGEPFADSTGTGASLIERIEGLIEHRLADSRNVDDRSPRGTAARDEPAQRSIPVLPAVVVVIENDAPLPRSRLARLAERGPDAGVHVIWVAPDVASLPASCRAFLVVDGESATVGAVRFGEFHHPVAVEALGEDDALRLARRLAAVVDAGAMVEDESDLPRSVSYATLAGPSMLDDAGAVVERWRETGSIATRAGPIVRRRTDAHLHALVGHSGSQPLVLDLRVHGPHALVGGTTGSGKSEFLQSWVLGMATAHSPDRVTFLFVDYKGGAAFADCVHLPHAVGLVTDLSQHLVRRALTSLRAELRHREHLLNRKKAKDLVSLERTGDPETPPSLVIVVDEFAALATEVPEFVDGVVDIAQRGRSLGLHLVLATQRPAGVIRDNLRANTNLRIALRMADEDDSTDILGAPLAAHFDPSIPGRGAVKTGPGRIVPFQTGYAGGWTTAETEPARVDIAEMAFGATVEWEVPGPRASPERDPGPTDISRIARTIIQASRDVAIPAPRRPWLPELAPTYDFSLLPNARNDEELLLGVVDDAKTQSQPTFAYHPDRDGNMAVYGTGGAGKSATLRALAVASAVTPRGGPVHVYGLDFGARGLRLLEDLPHVGAIIDGDDEEGVGRVLRMLRLVVDDRASRYAAVRADSVTDFRERAAAPDEPRILLLIDGMAAFREAYEFSTSQLFSVFSQIAVDGRRVGVHVVLTADRSNAIPMSVAATIQRRLVLRMATEDDYVLLGVPKDVLNAASPPGRGVIDGNEVQVAMLGGSANLAVQDRELAKLAASMNRQGVPRTPGVGRLPSHVSLDQLPGARDGRLAIGIDDETLDSAVIEARGAFLVSGPPGSGRSTALVTLAQAARRRHPEITIAHLAPRRTSLSGLGVFASSFSSPETAADAAGQLIELIDDGKVAAGQLMVVVESLAEFSSTLAEGQVERLVKACVRADLFVVGESESSTWSQAYTLAPPFKAGRRGLLLVPGEMEGDTLLATPLGRFKRADLPPGRGFLVAGGRSRRLQVAMPM